MDITTLTSLIPVDITLEAALKFMGCLIAAVLIAGGLFRLLFGKGSAINRAVCAALDILLIYVLTVIVYTFQPSGLQRFLAPLPFVEFSGSCMYLLDFANADTTVLCAQILSMVILVLLYNLTDAVLPDGDRTSALSWFVLRFVTVLAAMVVHYFITAATQSFLPDLLLEYGALLLVVCLFGSLFLGVLSFLLSLVMTAVNPFLGLLFGFFFSNKFGRQLSKATLSALLLTALAAILSNMGYQVINIQSAALPTYLPLVIVLLGPWYILGRKF